MLAQALGDGLGAGNGAVLSARASDGNRDEWLQFCQIAGEHGGQKIRIAQSEIACAGLGEDVVGHGLVFSGEMTQFINPVGVLQEAHVDDVIGVEGQAVLESEGFDGDLEGALLPRHDVADAAREIVDAHVGGVDDLVGCAAQGREEALFGLDAIHEGAGTLEGMGSS